MKLFRSILTVGVVAIFALWLSGCGSEKKKKAKKAKSVHAVKAKQIQMEEMLETTGDVVAVNTVTLRAAVEGPIKYCPWREGDVIKKAGEKLIEIERPLYKKQLAVKKAILKDLQYGPRPEEIAVAKEEVIHLASCSKFAKIDLDRINSLAGKNVVSKQSREKAEVRYVRCKTQLEEVKNKLKMLEEGTKKTELAIAEANVALAQTQVDECIIRAPFAGIITQVYVRPGDLTSLRSGPRPALIKMMDPKSLIIRSGLPESSAAHLSKGKKVIIRLDAYPGKTFNAKIERVHPRIEWHSRTRIVEIRITEPVKLIPRMFARVSVQGRVIENAIVIPDAAIITTPRGDHVVFVVKNGKAEMRKIKIGLEKKDQIHILEGIQADEMVITAGNLNLKNGAAVKIIKANGEKKKLAASIKEGAKK